MLSHLQKICAAAALAAALPAFADRHSETADSDTRDSTKWLERESHRSSGAASRMVGISQEAGQIVINGERGKSGGAAYLSRWRTDWNDSFRTSFKLDFASSAATRSTQTAVSGVAFGADYTVGSSMKTGVMVQVRQALDGTTVQLVARKSGRTIAQSARVQIDPSLPHTFEVAWVPDAATRSISVALYMDGNLAQTVATLNGVQRAFTGRRAGITTALYGFSKGDLAFKAGFDDFSYSGDDRSGDDDNDDSWCDSDDHGDDQDDDHGGSGATRVDPSAFSAALDAAVAANSGLGGIVKSEVEDGALDVYFKESDTTVLVVRMRLSDNTVISSQSRDAALEFGQLDWDELLSVIGSVTVSAQSAIATATDGDAGATVSEVELEKEHGAPLWKVKYRDANGIPLEREVSAN